MTLQRFKLILSVLILAGSTCFSQEINPDIAEPAAQLKPERVSAIRDDKTKITIKSNVSDAQVFLNGQYEGNTTLVINRLPRGHYRLRVEKSGYEPKRYMIDVRGGEDQTFYIELEKYQGQVTFSANLSDCTILADGKTVTSSTVTLDEGEHTVTAKKFGWTEQKNTIYVYRNTYQQVNFELKEAEFAASDFKANKNSFNPSLPGNMGKIRFSFYVTAANSGTISIETADGKKLFTTELPEYTTWNQTVLWDGTTGGRDKIADGTYKAILSTGDFLLETEFTADSSISIPAATVTQSGSGIGVLPMAFRFPKNTFALSVNAGIDFSSGEKLFYGAPLSLGAAWQPLDFMELSARGGILAGHEGASPYCSGSLKLAFRSGFSSGYFDWGLLFRAGGASNSPFEPYGQDNGAGLGGGIVLGLDLSGFYAGFSSEYTWSASTWNGHKRDSVIRNGAAIQFKTGAVTAALFGAVNSCFGQTELENDNRTTGSFQSLRAIEGGVDLQLQPGFSPYYVNLRAEAVHFENKNYIKAEAGFTILL